MEIQRQLSWPNNNVHIINPTQKQENEVNGPIPVGSYLDKRI